jgi:hypothetical protein
MIVFYIVYSHLAEARYAWDLPFHTMYLAPGFLAAGLLVHRLARSLDSDQRRLIFICGLTAAFCAALKPDYLPTRLPLGAWISPFRAGLIAVTLFFLHGWMKFRKAEPAKSGADLWALAASSAMLFVVSGNSMAEVTSNIADFGLVPTFYVALMLAVFSVFAKSSVIPTLAGWSFLAAILSHLPISDGTAIGIFYQACPIWFALIQWRYHGRTREWAFSLAGVFACLMAALMCLATHHTAWAVDYMVLTICMFLVGRELRNVLLWVLSVLGMSAVPIYFGRNLIGELIDEVRQAFGPGTVMTMLAFLMLPLAYFMSVMKKRRQE